jgi:hypothetical protein
MSRAKLTANRIRIAKEKGAALVRRLEDMEKLSADEVVELAESLEALLVEYPDVYRDPPVPLELLREHVEGLRQAEAEVRKEQAEEDAVSRKLAETRRLQETLALGALAGPRAKGEKPS